MMGWGTKKLLKTLFIDPSGTIKIKGNPYEKVVDFTIRNLYQILVSAKVNKESVKLTFTYFDSFPIEIYFDKEEKCARFLEICE